MTTSVSSWKPRIVAHRGHLAGGFSRHAENSAEAFAEALQAGFPSECDVQQSSDGQPVVIHDSTLDRTTFASGDVSAYSLQQLREIRLRTPEDRMATVPLLHDVADLVSLVEIKPADAPHLVEQVIRIMCQRSWSLQSFDALNLLHARRLMPSLPVVLLVDEESQIQIAVEHCWPVYLDHILLQDHTAGQLQDAGLSVGVWTVNEDAHFNRVLQYRPDVIISDVPLLVRRWLAASGAS